jgi:hypothetical protein
MPVLDVLSSVLKLLTVLVPLVTEAVKLCKRKHKERRKEKKNL